MSKTVYQSKNTVYQFVKTVYQFVKTVYQLIFASQPYDLEQKFRP